MKYSIIIATYNAGRHLAKAIESLVLEDTIPYELIIIDGGSSDNTLEIISRYRQHINYWVSERDNGIYDAWNKGLKVARGEWIMFIGADDQLNQGALKKYDNFINASSHNKDLHFISSRIEMLDLNGEVIRVKGWRWEWPKFLKEMTVAHPGALHSKKLFEEYGVFDSGYKITGDYELLLRPRANLKCGFMDEVTVRMSEGGASDSTAAILEHKNAAISTGGANWLQANINHWLVWTKFKLKKFFRSLGINIYLKR